MIFILIYLNTDYFIQFALNNQFLSNAAIRFAERSSETIESSSRSTMWANYFDNLDFSRIIFGVNLETDPWDEGITNEFNYHNSFINLHIQTGIVGLLIIMLMILTLFKLFWTNRIYFFLFIALIFRSFTDSVLFFGRYDFIFFFFIFTLLKKTSKFNHISQYYEVL